MKKIFAGLMCLALAVPYASAVSDPVSAKAEADGTVRYAMEIYSKAAQMLQGPVSQERLRGAFQLYIQAGQLFEKAMKAYQALGPTYAQPADVQNSAQLMQQC